MEAYYQALIDECNKTVKALKNDMRTSYAILKDIKYRAKKETLRHDVAKREEQEKITSRHDVAMLKFVLLNFLFVIKSLWLYFTLLILQCRILGWSIFVEKYIYYGLFFRNNKKWLGHGVPT